MSTVQKIIMGLLVLAVATLSILLKIQTDDTNKERKRASTAEHNANYNAEKANLHARLAEQNAAETNAQMSKVEILKQELEACKKKK